MKIRSRAVAASLTLILSFAPVAYAQEEGGGGGGGGGGAPAPTPAPAVIGGGNGPIVGTYGVVGTASVFNAIYNNGIPPIQQLVPIASTSPVPTLSAATTTSSAPGVCNPPITGPIKFGADNNRFEVTYLQEFLNQFEKANLTVSGIYDIPTLDAVNAFQIKYNKIVLKPWADAGLLPNDVTPTGIVYRTTSYAINVLRCPNAGLLPPVIK